VRRRAGLLAAVFVAAGLTGAAAPSASLKLPASPLSEDERVLHVLNRLGYGPRPADVARVRQIGVGAYLEQQLHPERIPGDAVRAALVAYPVLNASPSQLVRDYPQPTPEMRRQIASGDLTRRELRALLPPGRRPAVITAQLQAAAVTRAVLSDAQDADDARNFAADSVSGFNVNSMAIELPITMLTRDGALHAAGDPLAVIGTYATTSRPRIKTQPSTPGARDHAAWSGGS